MHVIRVCSADIFAQIPLCPIGDLKNHSGTLPGPRASARVSARLFAPHSALCSAPWACQRSLGPFSNPLWDSGNLGEDPLEKTRITYVYLIILPNK